jgi:hypothetical protein
VNIDLRNGVVPISKVASSLAVILDIDTYVRLAGKAPEMPVSEEGSD